MCAFPGTHPVGILRTSTNLYGTDLNSRAQREWPRRGKVQDVLCKSAPGGFVGSE